MADSMTIKSRVNASLLDRVEQECYQILYQQRLAYNERWYSSVPVTTALPVLRRVGLLLSLLGIVLSVFYLVYPSACPRWYLAELFLLFFVAAALSFYVLARIEVRYISSMKQAGSRGCMRMARRLVSKARKIVPYVAEYSVKGDLLTYFRGMENDRWLQVWSRRIKGFAIMGETVTLLFRKPTSIVPTMLILHDNNEAVEPILKGLDLPYKQFEQGRSEPPPE